MTEPPPLQGAGSLSNSLTIMIKKTSKQALFVTLDILPAKRKHRFYYGTCKLAHIHHS